MAEQSNPQLVVVAGPNGAGKSTLAELLIPERFGILDYVNADVIAKGLSAFNPESVALDAGRITLVHLRDLAARRQDFAFETTLAGRSYARWIRELHAVGYRFHLLFVALAHPDIAVARVARRVELGGHNIPETVIRRRFEVGIKNFFELYRPCADTWAVYNNFEDSEPRLIASCEGQDEPKIVELELWQTFSRGRT